MKTLMKSVQKEHLCNRNQQKFCRDILAKVSAHDIARKEMHKVKPSAAVRKAYKIVRAFDQRQAKVRERAHKRINRERLQLQAAIDFAPASKALAMAEAFYNKYKS